MSHILHSENAAWEDTFNVVCTVTTFFLTRLSRCVLDRAFCVLDLLLCRGCLSLVAGVSSPDGDGMASECAMAEKGA